MAEIKAGETVVTPDGRMLKVCSLTSDGYAYVITSREDKFKDRYAVEDLRLATQEDKRQFLLNFKAKCNCQKTQESQRSDVQKIQEKLQSGEIPDATIKQIMNLLGLE